MRTRPSRIAFLGTPPFAVATLDAVAKAGHTVCCVVAQPDRPAGRGQLLRPPATKTWAERHGVPVLQPERVRDGALARQLLALGPDVLLVVAYGRILGDDLLGLAPHGAVNVHASLLPRWRGAAPIQWAIAAGDRETGVTLMRVEAGLDSGPILMQRAVAIHPDATAASLHDELAAAGSELAVAGLPLLAEGRLTPVAQDAALVTVARVLEKEDGRLDFALSALELEARIRAFQPWPGAFTLLRGRRLKVFSARPAGPACLAPGEVRTAPEGLVVGCGPALEPGALTAEGAHRPFYRPNRGGGGATTPSPFDALLLDEVQLEGGRRVTAAELARGHALGGGTVLGA